MRGRHAMTNQVTLVRKQNTTRLYASGLLPSSITIMATAVRVSPSKHVGVILVGSGVRKEGIPPPSCTEQQSGLSIAHLRRLRTCTPFAHFWSSLFPTGRDSSKIGDSTLYTSSFLTYRDSMIRTCETRNC